MSTTYTKGINIHRYQGTDYGYTTHLKTLIDGETFADSANGITVTQVSQGGGYATVQVGFGGGGGGGCTAATPAVALSPATLVAKPGAAANFSVAVTNQDGAGCANTRFALSNIGTAAGSPSPGDLTLAAGQSGSSTLAPATTNLADGSYALTVTATDSDGVEPHHGASGQGGATLLVDGTPPSTPAGLKGSVDRQGRVSLSWSASSDALSGVAGYTVYRNDAAIGQVSSVGFTDSTATAGTTYQYAVSARDVAGNASAVSGKVTVTVAGKSGKK